MNTCSIFISGFCNKLFPLLCNLVYDRNHYFGLDSILELVSKELNHLAAILHVYAGGLNFMK